MSPCKNALNQLHKAFVDTTEITFNTVDTEVLIFLTIWIVSNIYLEIFQSIKQSQNSNFFQVLDLHNSFQNNLQRRNTPRDLARIKLIGVLYIYGAATNRDDILLEKPTYRGSITFNG